MPVFLLNILGFFQKAFSKDYLPFTLTVLLGLAIFLNINTCNRLKIEKEARKQDREIFNQNFDAFLDSIRITYNKKLDAFEYDKNMFLTTLNDLAKYDSSLSRKLDDVNGDILSAIDTKVGIKNKPVEVDNTLENFGNDKYGLRWRYNYHDGGFTQYLTGSSRFRLSNNKIFADKTVIDTNTMTLNITYGFREIDNKYKVWAISQSPLVKLNELSGAYFIDKPMPYTPPTSYNKRWVIGPYIGYGVNFNNAFQDPRLGFNFGFSLTYNLFGFGKKPVRIKKNKTKKNNVVNDIKNSME